jgi:two-component system, cell cycle response regulator DivK
MLNRSPVVLVVGSPETRDMLACYLRIVGHQVVEADGGDEAVAAALQYQPALILLDVRTPGLTEWATTRQLKTHPLTSKITVIGVSAHANVSEERQRAHEAGCDAFVATPFDIKALGKAIVDVMALGRVALSGVTVLGMARR